MTCLDSTPEFIKEKFWRKVDKHGPIVRDGLDECWIWTGSVHKRTKYGYFCLPGRMGCEAHRVSWMIHRGDIPDGMYVLHICDNRPCVNPDHLFVGTAGDNMRDCVAKGRRKHLRGERIGLSKLTDDQVHKILGRIANGEPLKRIAMDYGVKGNTLSSLKSGVTWNHISRPVGFPKEDISTKGSRNGSAVVTETQVVQMRSMYESGIPANVIGHKFQISHAQAWRIVVRQSWRHI